MKDRKLRVLVVSPIPEEGAGCRFRIGHYIPYLEANGFEVTLVSLFTTSFFRLVYKPGNLGIKAFRFAGLALRHLWRLRRARDYDVIFIYREIFPVGPAWVEWLLARVGPPIVFDFDDAIFLPSVSEANRLIAALKTPGKVATIVRRSAQVVVGNDYLGDYARQFNPRVTMIPTGVDTTRFTPPATPRPVAGAGGPMVGWIGSPTTAAYLMGLAPVLQQVAASQPFVLKVSGTGDPVRMPGVAVENAEWRLNGEIDLFRSCDIGVYPLVDDAWAKGKCGFKAIEFMACGVPVVASAVGVNREIIEDGVNGFLASSEEEWIAKLGRLIAEPALRARFAAAGRRTIEERYSLHVNAPKLADVLQRAARRVG